MRKVVFSASFVVLLGIALLGCGSSNSTSTTGSNPVSGSVPVSFSISDTPPMGVTILRFQIQVTGATLQPGSVPLLNSPVSVDLERLQSEPALLANLNVPAGTYTSLNVTFANPQMTILNQTGATLTVDGQNCAVNEVCTVTPTLNAMSVTVSTSPFPITLSASSPVGFLLHFDVYASVQNDLSVTPTVSVFEIPSSVFQHFHVVGVVTNVSSPNFTLQTDMGGLSLNVTTNSNTIYDFGPSCPAENFGCIVDGQILRVKGYVQSGAIVAERIRLLEPPSLPSLQGLVIGVNAAQDEFQVVVLSIPRPMANISLSCGLGIVVQPSATATFNIDSDGLTIPPGLSFASIQDMLVGQVVEFQPVLPTSTGGGPPPAQITLTTNGITLEDSQITATVGAVNASATPPNFELNNLFPLFTSAGITQIEVEPVTGTQFQNVSGLSGLSTGEFVSVGGLLFNTPTNSGGPTLIPEDVVLRQQM